ncbi:hypothetical protein BABINDRAFT_161052 [Babjeviella inositovora NRRL Y-12698]|uniref:Vacuolar protein sorting-associated protein 55 n=1 Tax=Babjeviella inositovora NRRL Y-12698 TaxID=984486 RepID=A0A1E3QT28_9ASCO|nr:uncharacterized protein BABINDRAFT_161052 [Babjeviella inositovora NRRL Y-12698]ODQ80849.1 hypothetical protein BABINDRAFT_161052 [Babjeviella inositovora NRRL Y-12698]
MSQKSPLARLISLSYVLALGFLFVVLAGAIYGNWYPILVALIFSVAHLPMVVTNNYSRDDFMNESSIYVNDFGKFLSGFLLFTGFAIPLVLCHSLILTTVACILTELGGSLIYASVFAFTTYFDSGEESFEI